jgi:hypothetical protein
MIHLIVLGEKRRSMMARPEVTGRRPGAADNIGELLRKTGPPVGCMAFTIPEFCVAHRISESFYYKIRLLGLGPRERRIEDKVIITGEAAAEWRNPQKSETTAA